MLMKRAVATIGFVMFGVLGACKQHEPSPPPLPHPVVSSPTAASTTTAATTTASTNVAATWTTAYGPPLMTGTELRALVPFRGKLFAGVGYWKDTSADEPTLPGARVVVLDAADARWRTDLELDEVLRAGPQAGRRRYQAIGGLDTITITTDEKGAALESPVHILAAGPWSRSPGVDVFVRGNIADGATPPAWLKTTLGDPHSRGNVRSFVEHIDRVTKVSRAFAGSDDGVFSGTWSATRNTIAWNTVAEPFARDETPPPDWRVMAFVEANGLLFASIGAAIYERQDGASPTWKRVYTATFPPNVDIKGNGGLRGIAAISNPHSGGGGGGDVLLVAAGGPTAKILRVDPSAGFSEEVDVDVVALLSKEWHVPVGGALLAYNNMVAVKDPRSGASAWLIGLEAHFTEATHPPFPTWFNFRAEATMLVRHANGSYDVRSIEDHALAKPPPPRVAIRTIALSPFEQNVIYAGGFDANDHPAHETAWALRGPLDAILQR